MNNLKKSYYLILWVLLAVTLVLSFKGVQLRTYNESNNRAIMTVADYKAFAKTANSANMNMDEILLGLQENGVKNIAVNEVTLRDLAYNGDIYVSS
ncbi:MAG: DUF5693 family protein, partial [Syntrophomonas sp.]|nr:DUF5693 family protein [Syntrophomonas sp.]